MNLFECTKQCTCTASSLPLFQLFQWSRLTKLLLMTFSGKHALPGVRKGLPKNASNNYFVSLLHWKSWKRGRLLVVHCNCFVHSTKCLSISRGPEKYFWKNECFHCRAKKKNEWPILAGNRRWFDQSPIKKFVPSTVKFRDGSAKKSVYKFRWKTSAPTQQRPSSLVDLLVQQRRLFASTSVLPVDHSSLEPQLRDPRFSKLWVALKHLFLKNSNTRDLLGGFETDPRDKRKERYDVHQTDHLHLARRGHLPRQRPGRLSGVPAARGAVHPLKRISRGDVLRYRVWRRLVRLGFALRRADVAAVAG